MNTTQTPKKKVQAEEWPGLIFGGIALVVISAMILGFFYGWILMLLLGVVHHNISTSVPAVSYAVCFWPAVLLRILIAQNRTSN